MHSVVSSNSTQIRSVEEHFLKECRRNCDSRDLSKIKACLTLGVDVNCRASGDLETLPENQGESNPEYDFLSWTIYRGWTGLHFVIRYCNDKFLKLLLSQPNIDVNVRNKEGQTPLMMLIEDSILYCSAESFVDHWKRRRLSLLKTLMKRRDLIVNTRNTRTQLPFSHAVMQSDFAVEIIEILKHDPRVDWNVINKDGKTPIQHAFEEGQDSIFEALIEIDSVDTKMLPSIVVKHAREIRSLKRKRESKLECLVCYDTYLSPRKEIYQCIKGHFVCGACRPRLDHCAQCRGQIIGRAHGFEKFIFESEE